jgi:hypothetical protein
MAYTSAEDGLWGSPQRAARLRCKQCFESTSGKLILAQLFSREPWRAFDGSWFLQALATCAESFNSDASSEFATLILTTAPN